MNWQPRWLTQEERTARVRRSELEVSVGGARLIAHVRQPESSLAMVISAHPGATAELAPREHQLATVLADAGFATLLIGLATDEEDRARVVVDVPRLAERLLRATRLAAELGPPRMALGYVGVGDAAAAALVATAMDPRRVRALVARSSRPERAGMSLMLTRTPTLFIVSEDQQGEHVANRVACELASHARLELVPSGLADAKLPPAVSLSAAWFSRWLSPLSANAWVDELPPLQMREPLGAWPA